MRVTNDYSNRGNTCLFVGDRDEGTLVQLPSGKEIILGYSDNSDEPYIDSDTGKEVFIPGWTEW